MGVLYTDVRHEVSEVEEGFCVSSCVRIPDSKKYCVSKFLVGNFNIKRKEFVISHANSVIYGAGLVYRTGSVMMPHGSIMCK